VPPAQTRPQRGRERGHGIAPERQGSETVAERRREVRMDMRERQP